jgi:hypothetical protein
MLAFLCVPLKQECNADRDTGRVNTYICLHVIVFNFGSVPRLFLPVSEVSHYSQLRWSYKESRMVVVVIC